MSDTDWPKDSSEAFAWKLHGKWTTQQHAAYQEAQRRGAHRRFLYEKAKFPEWAKWVERGCAKDPDWCNEEGRPKSYVVPTEDRPPPANEALSWLMAVVAVVVLFLIAYVVWNALGLPGQGSAGY